MLAEDGRLAYASNDGGEFNVYVRFPEGPRAERISVAGGSDRRWRADGEELFFIAEDGTLMAVDMRDPRHIGEVTPLFPTQVAPARSPYLSAFVPSPDGRRFLVRVPVAAPETYPLTVTLNWTARLLAAR